jgi:hypothetical protein
MTAIMIICRPIFSLLCFEKKSDLDRPKRTCDIFSCFLMKRQPLIQPLGGGRLTISYQQNYAYKITKGTREAKN